MPSLSPGEALPSSFAQILPGSPTNALQTVTTYTFRWKRYVVYNSGKQLNILRSATELVQALTFDDDLVAVRAEGGDDGRIAVATAQDVWILEPQTNSWNHVTWKRALLLRREDAGDEARSICWGNDGELLVGGSRQLSLFNTLPSSRNSSPASTPRPQLDVEERNALWSKGVSSPVRTATFSPSAGLIASCGHPDRLVKIWRRLSFEEGLFDYAYLPHPGPVTHLEWRVPDASRLDEDDSDDQRAKAYSRQEEEQEVLYTLCTDGIMRVWKTGGHQDLDILALHTTVNLVSAIPHSPILASNGTACPPAPTRYAFILTASDLASSITSAIAKHPAGKLSHAAEHLKEVASKHPDIVISLDGHGRMSAWGLQSVGHKRRPSTPSGAAKQAYHIAHAEDSELKIPSGEHARFETWFEGDVMNVLVHVFGEHGSVQWWSGSVESFFSPAAIGDARIKRVAHWSGDAGIMEGLQPKGAGSVSASESDKSLTQMLGFDKCRVCDTSCDVAVLKSTDERELIIVEQQEGYMEHRQRTTERIKHLRFSNDRCGYLLAVTYAEHVDVLARGRYRAEHDADTGIWQLVKSVSIAGIGLDIKSIEWCPDGKLALAAGNGAFVDSGQVGTGGLEKDTLARLPIRVPRAPTLNDVTEALQDAMPVWHPDVIYHLGLQVNLGAVFHIFRCLEQKLKFYAEGDDLHPTLDLELMEVSRAGVDKAREFDTDTAHSLHAQLDEISLPRISPVEQQVLKVLLDAAAAVREHTESLDVNALRYLYSWQIQVIMQGSSTERSLNGETAKSPAAPAMGWRDIAFAYHSETQQPLLEILNAHYGKSLDWPAIRNLGIPAWVRTVQAAQSEGSDLASLEQIFESLAQTAYRASYPPDPARAALYFLALRKKPTLLALWRVVVGNREQKSTMNFLKRDFSAEENKTAARKNAYALMGKRRFEYAAAFFLLADDAASAIRILVGQCEDILLGIAVARVYCGDGSAILRAFVDERVMPAARKSGDRWQLSWSQDMMDARPAAAQALIAPFAKVLEVAEEAEDEQLSRRWQQDDPLTMTLYDHLRTTTSRPGRAKGTVSLGAEKLEYKAVLRSARILRRMGLWIQALELTSNWKFSTTTSNAETEPPSSATIAEPTAEPVGLPSMLDGFDAPSTPVQGNGGQPKLSSGGTWAAQSAPLQETGSMLNAFTSQQQQQQPSAPPSEAEQRKAKAAELLAKLKAKKGGAADANAEGGGEKEKKKPTQFKEPEASSILDSFGF